LRRTNYDLSTALVAVGAIAVLISLFLDWYEPGLSAFDVFEVTDWLLVALAVGALVVIGTEAWGGGSARSNRLAWICGILAFLVVAQVLDPPPAARGASREIGAWLALAGSAAMVAGAVMAVAEISVTIDVAERERRRRTAAVDARDEEVAAAGSPPPAPDAPARSGLSGLWQAPAAGSDAAAEAPTSVTPPSAARPRPPKGSDTPRTPDAPEASSSSDPDRTQPLRPSDRPDGDDAPDETV
jgi:hypothetical protein